MEDQDAELLRALQDEHGDALFAHAVRLTGGDRQRAEDLVQETLLRAWRYPEALDPERGAVRSWLFTTARNLAIDAWRRRSVRVGEVVTDMLPEPPPSADEADRAVEAWTVAEALGRLSPTHREVLVECFYQGRRWPRRPPGWAYRPARSSRARTTRCARCGWFWTRWG